jgi:cytochrome c biogenesis protein
VSRVWALLVSLRASAIILAVLAALMLANVVVPQREVSAEAYAQLLARGGVTRYLVETVGLGHVSTSPVFQLTLWIFFVNLAAVLIDRMGSTLRRLRAEPPTPAQLAALVERSGLEVAPDHGWSPAAAERVLQSLGYKVGRAGEQALWAVKFPAAVLGFPLFHLSFFVLAAAGVQLYQTRQVAEVVVTEGQRIEGSDLRLVRRAPAGEPPPVDLVLERVDLRLERGFPLELAATLRSGAPGAPTRTARVNDPAEWGDLTVLVERAGLAPVLRLADARGYTVDRVAAVMMAQDGPTTVGLGDGRIQVVLEPVPVGPGFPERAALAGARLRTVVRDGGRVVFDGPLAPRVPVAVGGEVVQIEELRYWASLRLVNEQGGGLLVLGFCVLVAGIVWRMVWFRREVAVVWEAGRVRLAGRGEFYPARFREEIERIRRSLESPGRLGQGVDE